VIASCVTVELESLPALEWQEFAVSAFQTRELKIVSINTVNEVWMTAEGHTSRKLRLD